MNNNNKLQEDQHNLNVLEKIENIDEVIEYKRRERDICFENYKMLKGEYISCRSYQEEKKLSH